MLHGARGGRVGKTVLVSDSVVVELVQLSRLTAPQVARLVVVVSGLELDSDTVGRVAGEKVAVVLELSLTVSLTPVLQLVVLLVVVDDVDWPSDVTV